MLLDSGDKLSKSDSGDKLSKSDIKLLYIQKREPKSETALWRIIVA